MKLILRNCLEYETVLNLILAPYWGEVNPDCGGWPNISNNFNVSLITKLCGIQYKVKVNIFGIIVKKAVFRTSIFLAEILELTIESCVREIELMFVKYSTPNEEFYRYPAFVLLQILQVKCATRHMLVFPSMQWKGCKIHSHCDRWYHKYYNLTVNEKIININIDAIEELLQQIMDRKANVVYYYEQPFVRMKSATSS